MPAAIVKLELVGRKPRQEISTAPHEEALLVLFWDGRAVGQIRVAAPGGVISPDAAEQAIAAAAGWDFWLAWLHDSLRLRELREQPRHFSRPQPMTVAICTRERPEDLTRCLEAVSRLPDEGQEVLVVDNRPATSATLEVVGRFPKVRYTCQRDGGLDAARNRALAESRHSIVAFTDDDAVVDRNWLRALGANFDNPRVACVTGLTLPLELETDAQDAFERYAPFGRGFGRRVFDLDNTSVAAMGPVGAGANMAVRRDVVFAAGGFDPALDGGTPARSGGDHEMFSRLIASGFQIVYDPAALSWHRHRRTWRELRDVAEGYGTGVYAMWTKMLLEQHEFSVLRQAWLWLRHGQVPGLARALRQRDKRALAILLAEARGCLRGPFAYLLSRRAARRTARRAPGATVATMAPGSPEPAPPGDGT